MYDTTFEKQQSNPDSDQKLTTGQITLQKYGTSFPHLDCCLMLVQCEQRSRVCAGHLVPDTQQVVIGPTGQIAAIARPLQTTDLLCVGKI